MLYCTYILKSQKSGKIYIGQTKNLQKRITLHNLNNVISTKNKGPWEIIYHKEFSNRSEAMNLERKLKDWKNRDRIIKWINNQNGAMS